VLCWTRLRKARPLGSLGGQFMLWFCVLESSFACFTLKFVAPSHMFFLDSQWKSCCWGSSRLVARNLCMSIPILGFPIVGYIQKQPMLIVFATLSDVLHLLDIVCCLMILLPIVWSIRHLRSASGEDNKDGKGAFLSLLFNLAFCVFDTISILHCSVLLTRCKPSFDPISAGSRSQRGPPLLIPPVLPAGGLVRVLHAHHRVPALVHASFRAHMGKL